MKKYIVKKLTYFKSEPYALVSSDTVADTINDYSKQGYKFEDLTAIDDTFYIVMSIEDAIDEEE